MEVCKGTDCRNISPAGCAEGLCGDHCAGCDVHKGGGKALLEKRRALAEAIRKRREELEKAKAAAPPAPPQWTRYRGRDSAPSEEEELLRAIEESRKSNSLFEGFTYAPPQPQEINISEEQISTIQAILPDFPEEQIVKAFKMQRGDVERTIDFLLTLPTPTTTTSTTSSSSSSSSSAFSATPEPIADEEEPEEPQRTSLTAEEFQTLKPEEQVKRFLEVQKKLELLEQERLELKTTINKQEREIFCVTGGFSFEVWKNLQKENVLKLQATFEKECVVCLEEKEGLYLTSCGCKVVCRGCYRILKKPRHCPQCNKPIK